MTCNELYEWMANPELMTKASLLELRQMVDDYPYFHAARLLYLKNLAVLKDVRLNKEMKKMSIYIPDRRLLYMLINDRTPAGTNLSELKPPLTSDDNKTKIILEALEKSLPADEPDENDFISTLVSKPITPVIATSDYANWLAQHAEDLPQEEIGDNRLKHQDLIDSFIAIESSQLSKRLSNTDANKTPAPTIEDETPVMDSMENISLDDSYFTETLARVYVGQKRYDKALEIIRALSLKYPKKNLYFADQIRYLEKIINIKK